jgi:hypothetical protein
MRYSAITDAGVIMSPTMDRAEANRLYWETDESVAGIARRFDLSRRALYEAIEPLPAGRACEMCGAPLSFENRSARLAGDAACPICSSAGHGVTDFDMPPQPLDEQDDDRVAVLGGAALVGAMAGAMLTFMVVSRR